MNKAPILWYETKTEKVIYEYVSIPFHWGVEDDVENQLIEKAERFVEMFGGKDEHNTVTKVNGLNVLARDIIDLVTREADRFTREVAFNFVLECGRALFPYRPAVGEYIATDLWNDAWRKV